jgi:hypothetical protein
MRTPLPLRAFDILRAGKHLLRELRSFVAVERSEIGASGQAKHAIEIGNKLPFSGAIGDAD